MPSTRDVITSLYGAWRLAHLDRGGLAFFDSSPSGVRRSFFAAALVAPFFALMLTAGAPEAGRAHSIRYAVVEAIAYVVTWTAYPVLIEWLSRFLGCRERFERYLVAYNWSMVLQNAAVLPIGILAGLGVLPHELAQLMWLIVFVLVLAYLSFVARAGLEVSAVTAAGLVVVDVLLSALIDGVAGGMY